MRVAHFVWHSCIRTHKLAYIQRKFGFETYLVHAHFDSGHPSEAYDFASKVFGEVDSETGELAVSADRIAPTICMIDKEVDLWHCHNQPDWLVPLVKQCTKKPVVYDVHDYTSITNPGMSGELEAESFNLADAVATISDGYKEIIRPRYPHPKPILVYESRCPKDFYKTSKSKWEHLIVYQGSLGAGHDPVRGWLDTFDYISRQRGIDLQVLPASKKDGDIYRTDLGEHIVLQPQPYFEMLRILSNAEAGIVGSPVKSKMLEASLPNKFWEYIAAGIPVICFNSPEVEAIIKKHGLGMIVTEKEGIPSAVRHIRTYREDFAANIEKYRQRYSMDAQFPLIKLFYELLLNWWSENGRRRENSNDLNVGR